MTEEGRSGRLPYTKKPLHGNSGEHNILQKWKRRRRGEEEKDRKGEGETRGRREREKERKREGEKGRREDLSDLSRNFFSTSSGSLCTPKQTNGAHKIYTEEINFLEAKIELNNDGAG